MPVTIAGVMPWNGKKKPVTLVATVVARKNAVHQSSRFRVSSPNTTQNPEAIATRLMRTWMSVNKAKAEFILFIAQFVCGQLGFEFRDPSLQRHSGLPQFLLGVARRDVLRTIPVETDDADDEQAFHLFAQSRRRRELLR